jgi:type IV pilus assembly protein PilC
MAVYQWSGKTPRGIIESGEITASTKEDVIAILGKKNIVPTLIAEKPKKALFALGGRIKDKDIVVFTRQFSTMINAGLPLVQALEILSTQVENKAFGKIIGQVKTDVESGLTYADSLKKHPKIFSELYANMVAAGEAGGILDTILNRLAAYIEKAMKLKKKVKGAMVYPAVISTVAVLVIVIIMVFVVPTFSRMFAQLGGTLPLPTRMVIGLSKFIAGTGGIVSLVSLCCCRFIIQFKRTEKGKR